MKKLFNITTIIAEALVNKRNDNFDKGLTTVHKVAKPVISIGNLSFGGTGKTPFTIALATELHKNNCQAAVIGKGYKRIYKDVNIISDGKKILTSWLHSGDEMYLIAKHVNCPVIVHKQKYKAAQLAEQLDIQVIIVDDGFQHRYLARDLDLVIIDQQTINKPFMPTKGILREPIDSLKRADYIIHSADIDLPDKFLKFIKTEPIKFQFVKEPFYDLFTKTQYNYINNEVIPFCGIANPKRFLNSLIEEGIHFPKSIEYPDHHRYSQKDIQRLASIGNKHGIKIFITTEKDAVKLEEYTDLIGTLDIQILVLPIKIKITNGKQTLLAHINKIIENYE